MKPNGGKFQSTRPRGRTRHKVILCYEKCDVSIHASSREDATRQHWIPVQTQKFQSTRPRGRTRHFVSASALSDTCFNPRVLAGGRDAIRLIFELAGSSFNPRVLAGGRDPTPVLLTGATAVSIHASSREDATPSPGFSNPKTICFNPRVLAGGRDAVLWPMVFLIFCFNPRVLAGGRDCECRKQYKSKCYICKSAKEIILIINEEQYHFS